MESHSPVETDVIDGDVVGEVDVILMDGASVDQSMPKSVPHGTTAAVFHEWTSNLVIQGQFPWPPSKVIPVRSGKNAESRAAGSGDRKGLLIHSHLLEKGFRQICHF